MIHPHSGILVNHKKGGSTDSYYSTDEYWTHYSEFKKSYTQDHILHGPIHKKCPKQGNPRQTVVSWFPGAKRVGREGMEHVCQWNFSWG